VGFLPLGIVLFVAAGWLWKEFSFRWAFLAAGAFGAAFITTAAPYVAYLWIASGHWSIGREFPIAMMYGMGDVAHQGDDWRQLGWSAGASPFQAIYLEPQLYTEKVGQYFLVSLYNFTQALEPILTIMLAIGVCARRPVLVDRVGSRLKKIFQPDSQSIVSSTSTPEPTRIEPKLNRSISPRCKSNIGWNEAQPVSRSEARRLSESFLVAIVLFYFCGFVLTYTGTRFMVHLLPFIFGWVAAGIILVSETVAQWCRPATDRIAYLIVPAAIGITLLPRTLWPLGYDMRGMRYAGGAIAMMKKPATIAARDGRVAFYAGARFVELPPAPPEDFCAWLGARRGDFLMIGNRDEHFFNITRNQRCLELLKRYPRYGSGYYDLYRVRAPVQAGGGSALGIATP
jgi:hypothetical protein